MFSVVPAPLHVRFDLGHLLLRAGLRVEGADASLAPLVQRFRGDVARRTSLRTGPAAAPGDPAVRIELVPPSELERLPDPIGVSPLGDRLADERHSVTIEDGRIVVRAVEADGVARALTTVLQLLVTADPEAGGALLLPAARIEDAPRFAWRGLSLDVAGRYLAERDLRRVIDLLALYKLNVLHLHLTGDRGWRLAAGRPPGSGEPYGTFYSRAELRELAAYARDRFVTIVPEVGTPGNAAAILRLRPELATGRNVVDVEVAPGRVRRSAWLDPHLPASFAMVELVLADVAETFPGPFIDIGGSEPFGMPREQFVAFVRHVSACVRSLGRRTVGWQESIRAVADPDHVIQYWISGAGPLPPSLPPAIAESVARSPGDVAEALRRSVPVIVSPVSHAHLDVPYAEPSADPAQEALRGRVGRRFYVPMTVAETFAWEPAHALGPRFPADLLAGVAAALWTDTAADFADVAFLLLPRLAGAAEKAWSAPGDWAGHRERLARHPRLWNQDGLTYFRSAVVGWAAAGP